jgi:hypothetical protein
MAVEGAPVFDTPENTSEHTSDSNKEKDKKKSRKSWLELANRQDEDKKVEEAQEKQPPTWLEQWQARKKSAEAPTAETPVETPAAESAPETETVSEAEAPLEELAEAEKAEIEPKLIEVIEAIEADQAPDPVTDAPVELFREKVKAGEDSEAAFQEVIDELGGEEIDNVPEAPDESPEAGETIFSRVDDVESSQVEEDDTTAPVPPSPPGPPAPPAPPTPPGGPTPPFGPAFGPPSGSGLTWFNVAPSSPPAVNERAHNYDWLDDRASPAAMAFGGAIIGYLIGRRRGRIKTEKKLLPIQKKLEKEVTNLQFELQEKEKKIRRVAAAKVERGGPAVLEKIQQLKPERKVEERRRAPEAQHLHGPTRREHLGHVVVSAESRPAEPTQRSTETRAEKPMTNRRVETLNRAELLALSEKIIVEGSTLRNIYETHLIGERGLRRLVAEHMRGGDLAKALKVEITEREIDFERDPALRDMAPTIGGGGTAVGGKAALDQMLEKASQNIAASSEEAAFYKARAAYETQQFRQQQQQRHLVDAALVTTIVVLLSVVVYLAIVHHSL